MSSTIMQSFDVDTLVSKKKNHIFFCNTWQPNTHNYMLTFLTPFTCCLGDLGRCPRCPSCSQSCYTAGHHPGHHVHGNRCSHLDHHHGRRHHCSHHGPGYSHHGPEWSHLYRLKRGIKSLVIKCLSLHFSGSSSCRGTAVSDGLLHICRVPHRLGIYILPSTLLANAHGQISKNLKVFCRRSTWQSSCSTDWSITSSSTKDFRSGVLLLVH